ncbi:DUF885 domain-containing protein [Caulobacter sp. NIBR2454]|uniref:DUF885 domain-containing protein n=1 Tax=Caulobacter sp. NIBR2454 TaxID=3015996 RepID=UPI0022B64E00|nr:DUF885 family protein [Caulobacter sp. NIBR2454]
MDRRTFLATAAASAFAAPALAQTTGGAEDQRLHAMLDKFFYDGVEKSPTRATSLGLDKGARAHLKSELGDASLADRARRLEDAKQRLVDLKTIDRAKLSPAASIDYDVIAYQNEVSVTALSRVKFGEGGNGGYSPYTLDQRSGAYQSVPDFLDNQHGIANAADADAYVARVRAFATVLDQETDRMNAEAAMGVIAPNFILATTLDQIRALRGQATADTVLVKSISRRAKAAGLTADYASQVTGVVDADVWPALDRQIAALEALKAKSTDKAGAWTLPADEGYYAGAVQAATTTKMTPEEVHQMGLSQAAEITARMDVLLKGQGLTQGSVADRMTELAKRPGMQYPNTDAGKEEMIKELNAQIAALGPKLPAVFGRLPKTAVEVRRVPVNIQDGASNGYYQRPSLDGSRPGAFYINLKDSADWPKFSLATLTYHEASPGHHLQIGLQMENADVPLIRRTGGFSAFSEGWALYAEQLAYEMDVYKNDPTGELGYLQSFLFRAVRLVVDTGIHHKRWTRDQATAYMVGATGYTHGRVQREIDRYCVWPGQALSYKVGHTQWARLRDGAKAKLGSKFDIRQFHDAALLSGPMPLLVLEKQIDAYVARASKA